MRGTEARQLDKPRPTHVFVNHHAAPFDFASSGARSCGAVTTSNSSSAALSNPGKATRVTACPRRCSARAIKYRGPTSPSDPMARRTTCNGEAVAIAIGAGFTVAPTAQMAVWLEAISLGGLVRSGKGPVHELIETILPVDFHHAPERRLPADPDLRLGRWPGSPLFSESGPRLAASCSADEDAQGLNAIRQWRLFARSSKPEVRERAGPAAPAMVALAAA